jgi:hypothetical protein
VNDEKLKAILALVNAALVLSGQTKLMVITEIFRVSAENYQDFHGKPVDPALIPKFERIT